MNVTAGFRAVLRPGPKATLRIAASSVYRVFLNGHFVGHGPARAAHGFYRVDSWPLTLDRLENVLAIEVAGYNVNGYYLLDQPSFVQAEVVVDDQVLAATAASRSAFTAFQVSQRVQRVQRYSFQRSFIEVYRLSPDWDRWRHHVAACPPGEPVERCADKVLLPRRVLTPDFALRAATPIATGNVTPAEPKRLSRDRSLTRIGPALKGFDLSELDLVLSDEVQHIATTWDAVTDPASLSANRCCLLDLGQNQTGFIRADVSCGQPTRLWLAFDEILNDAGDVNAMRLGCTNVVEYRLAPGDYRLETMEPYTLRYLKVVCVEGECRIRGAGIREFAHPPVAATFASSDEAMNRVFAAAVNTFRQNTLDLYMDCPSRERAGWLCDSLFTSRVEWDLAGAGRVEHNFFENYLLAPRLTGLPGEVIPMCYPADHSNGVYILAWGMWFLLQLEEFLGRGGDPQLVAGLACKVDAQIEFLHRYENSDGLLEKLTSWVFVEWSKANDFVQDVNYPSNMLYAFALDAAGRLFRREDWIARAARVRQAIREQSFDGQFFVDNAIRTDGRLVVTRNRSEVCQYYAFFCGVADFDTHRDLWKTLVQRFGPQRAAAADFPDVFPANSLVGNMLRFELLSRDGRAQQILDESFGYLNYMAQRTGTLWEHDKPWASCNHGFASHAAHTFYRDLLGLRQVDRPARQVAVRLNRLTLARCEGSMPTVDGPLSLAWWKDGATTRYRLAVPPGWQAKVENLTGGDIAEA